MRHRFLLLAAAAFVASLVACGGDSSGPKIGPASKVTVTTSPTPSATVKTAVGTFAVKVADANGNGVSGNVVNFFASGGGGIDFAPSSAVSDESGIASTTVTLGTKSGSTTLTAYAVGVSAPATTTVTAIPGPIFSLVTTPKSMRFYAVGDTARITYALEDEFVWVIEGEVVLIDDGGETVLRPGDCAGFPAGDRNGHHFVNRSGSDALLLVVGTRDDADHGEYPDIDMKFVAGRYGGKGGYVHKDDTPY
jgi:mannose-6-phosphate isomerase-like protein (cupin superfamily)